MAEVRPFRGLRYPGTVDLDDLVAPPYDVLSAAQAAELRARSPFNAVHLDLPVGPGESPGAAAYTRAAEVLATWRRDGVLRREAEPAVYLVDQTYRGPDGRERVRRGFIARLVLADLEDGVVLPHERTHAGPKADRLALYRASHSDLSQIFLLFPDDAGRVADELNAAAAAVMSTRDAVEARDGDGNTHRTAPVFGAAAARVAALLRDQTLYIADGHHRYETALAYRDERRKLGDHSADTMMVYLCGMNDPGLTVFPTHRLLKGVDLPPMAEVLERLRPVFDVLPESAFGCPACERVLARELETSADSERVFGLYFPPEEACALVRLRDFSALDRLVDEGFSAESAALTVTILHYLIFRDALGIDPTHTEGMIDYVSDLPSAFSRLGNGEYALGAFINPTLVSEVKRIADQGATMPQKSTYFYPKLLTGLVYDALGD
ncbi:MAG TPA: DUF1015 domain-containing protein [Thermoleophilia bacterium]|nr:DUF1015 domain-containing protein [Thermoleophilia bacterium]